jgi:hypothetical protein
MYTMALLGRLGMDRQLDILQWSELVVSAFQCCIYLEYENFDQVADFVGAPHIYIKDV